MAKHLGRYDASVFFTLQICHLKRSNGDGNMPSSRGILHATLSRKVWLVPMLMFIFLRHEAKILSFLKALHHFFAITSAKITLRLLLSVINCFNGLLQSALENKSKGWCFLSWSASQEIVRVRIYGLKLGITRGASTCNLKPLGLEARQIHWNSIHFLEQAFT